MNEVDHYEEHRVLCLARYLLNKSIHERRRILAGMEKRHGANSVDNLKAAMTSEFKRMKEKQSKSVDEMREQLKQAAK